MADELKIEGGAPDGGTAGVTPGAGATGGEGRAPDAAAIAAAAASKSAGGADPVDKPAGVQADWPADWKEKAAGGDEKILKLLERRATPKDLAKSYADLNAKLSSGEYKKATAAPDAEKDPEGLKAWRAENNVPESFDKYDLKLDDGLVIGDEDKPYVDQFLKSALDRNFTQAQTKDALNIYFKMQEEQKSRMTEYDNTNKAAAEDEMRADWGPEFRANHNEVSTFLKNRFADEGGASLLEARLPDGKRIGDNAAFMNRFLEMSREINPAATLVPNSANPAATMKTEMDGLKEKMKNDPKGWSQDIKGQERYVALMQGLERLK